MESEERIWMLIRPFYSQFYYCYNRHGAMNMEAGSHYGRLHGRLIKTISAAQLS